MRYVCSICGYVFDEEVEGTPFSELPDTWTCPLCGDYTESDVCERCMTADKSVICVVGEPKDIHAIETFPDPYGTGDGAQQISYDNENDIQHIHN